MPKPFPIWTSLLVALILLVVAYFTLVRPRMQRWGLTSAELKKPLPGDEYVPTYEWGFKQAITIHATPEQIWPWLVQMGYKRAGWYSFDLIEGLMGSADFVDGHSATRIIPELQNLQVGDTIKIAQPIGFTVEKLEPNRLIFLHASVNTKTNQPLRINEPLPESYLRTSWTFYLEPVDAENTRLYVKMVFDAPPTFANTMMYGIFMDGGALLMEPKMLRGIKARAEK